MLCIASLVTICILLCFYNIVKYVVLDVGVFDLHGLFFCFIFVVLNVDTFVNYKNCIIL